MLTFFTKKYKGKMKNARITRKNKNRKSHQLKEMKIDDNRTISGWIFLILFFSNKEMLKKSREAAKLVIDRFPLYLIFYLTIFLLFLLFAGNVGGFLKVIFFSDIKKNLVICYIVNNSWGKTIIVNNV